MMTSIRKQDKLSYSAIFKEAMKQKLAGNPLLTGYEQSVKRIKNFKQKASSVFEKNRNAKKKNH